VRILKASDGQGYMLENTIFLPSLRIHIYEQERLFMIELDKEKTETTTVVIIIIADKTTIEIKKSGLTSYGIRE
jgi:hypothetical protein